MRITTLLLALLVVAGAAASEANEMLKPGDPFPAWKLTDHTGATVSSQDLAGTTYLLWYYPKALSPGCAREGCELRDNYEAFQAKGVAVLGVSFDDLRDNARFVSEHNFPFRLLSDTERDLAVRVGAADSPKRVWARRISYLVGSDGKVLKAYSDVNPTAHAGQVLADLEALGR